MGLGRGSTSSSLWQPELGAGVEEIYIIKGHSETIILETRDRTDERDHNTENSLMANAYLFPAITWFMTALIHKNIVFIKLHFTMIDSYSMPLTFKHFHFCFIYGSLIMVALEDRSQINKLICLHYLYIIFQIIFKCYLFRHTNTPVTQSRHNLYN